MFNKFLLSFFIGFIILILGGCSNTIVQETKAHNPCKKINFPKWVDDEFVGVSRITASSSRTEQKQIAFQRAIALLVMTKGNSQGSSLVSLSRELNSVNQKEMYSKNFKENSSMKITFKDINYDVKITNMWQDPCTKEIYINIKEK